MVTSKSTSCRPRVMVATATVGAGHNSVARAIVAGLAQRCDGIETNYVDVLDFTPWAFRTCYAGGFALGMSRYPRIYGAGFRMTNSPQGANRGRSERLRLWFEYWACKKFAAYVRRLSPDLVICTHFLPASILSCLDKHGAPDVRRFVVITDYVPHRFWYAEGVDHWFLPAEGSKDALVKWQVPLDRITVSGMPVHPKWSEPVNRAKAVADWALNGVGKVVLLSGGTEFTCGPILTIARRIVASCADAYVVVLAGRNKKLLAALATLPEAGQRLFGVGFTDRLHELVELSSLMVTKAGGATVTECLAKAKPMVLLNPVPGQEAGNAGFLASAGAAVIAGDINDTVTSVRRLLDDQAKLEAMSTAADKLYLSGTGKVAAAICHALRVNPSE